MSETLFGREEELATLGQFLDGLGDGPGVLVIQGDPGAGKTALWRAAAAAARDRRYRVLACQPAEPEAAMSFSTLGDIVGEALGWAGSSLPERQSRALRVAVLLEDPEGPLPDERTVALATLHLLRSLATDAPVVIAVDDYQWADAGTSGVIDYVLRRVRGERIGFVASVPTGRAVAIPTMLDQAFAERAPGRVLAGPLTTSAIDELLRSRLGTAFPLPLLHQVAAASGGNALFALEIGRGIREGEVAVEPGQPLAVPRNLEQLVERRLDGLGTDLRELLAVAAATAEPSVSLVAEVADDRRARARLEKAVQAGIVSLELDRIRFSHPLFASTLYHRVTPDRRRALHRRLAAVVPATSERARHLALAAEGPDADVAAVLEEAAREAAARGDRATAAAFSHQAADLTPHRDVGAREERWLAAAEHAFAAGDMRHARGVLEDLAIVAESGPRRADILRRLAKVRYRSDSVAVAARLLSRAAEEAGRRGPLRARVERDLAWAVAMCGDVQDAARHARVAVSLVHDAGERDLGHELTAASAMADFLLGTGIDDVGLRPAGAAGLPDPDVPIEWRPRMILGMLLKWSGDLSGAAAVFEELHGAALEAGDEISLPFLLAQRSEATVLAGDPRRGLAFAREASALARQTGQDVVRASALYATALAQAHLGMADDARTSARTAVEVAEAAGSVVSTMLAQSVLGFVELSLGDPAAASRVLTPLLGWLDVVGIREPGVIRFVPDAAEALVGVGATDRADEVLASFERDAERLSRVTPMLAAARVRALHTAATGGVAAAVAALDRALERHGGRAEPLERARAYLALGTILRRTRRRKAALEALTTAQSEFGRLGAGQWRLRASSLLGDRAHQQAGNGNASLTAAERRVAALVAQGRSNREVADQLFVSVRAVEVHLTSVYRKLGIASRTQLAARFAASGITGSAPDNRLSAAPDAERSGADGTLPARARPMR